MKLESYDENPFMAPAVYRTPAGVARCGGPLVRCARALWRAGARGVWGRLRVRPCHTQRLGARQQRQRHLHCAPLGHRAAGDAAGNADGQLRAVGDRAAGASGPRRWHVLHVCVRVCARAAWWNFRDADCEDTQQVDLLLSCS
eukprot:363133-Chlamydomonas_euryale.AAC.11